MGISPTMNLKLCVLPNRFVWQKGIAWREIISVEFLIISKKLDLGHQ